MALKQFLLNYKCKSLNSKAPLFRWFVVEVPPKDLNLKPRIVLSKLKLILRHLSCYRIRLEVPPARKADLISLSTHLLIKTRSQG